jgi:hypothetical protein
VPGESVDTTDLEDRLSTVEDSVDTICVSDVVTGLQYSYALRAYTWDMLVC